MRSLFRQIAPLRYVIHFIRRYKRRAELQQAVHQSPLRVVIGSSGIYESGWIATDIDQLNILEKKDWETYFRPSSIDVLLAEHVWEHLTVADGTTGIKNCFDYLKPQGYLRIAVPDGNHPDPEYIEHVRPGGTGIGADDHKILYTIESLSSVLESAGFKVHPLEYFDKNGQFHFEAWDKESGMVHRSSRYDRRNQNGQLKMTSLIIDAIKPDANH